MSDQSERMGLPVVQPSAAGIDIGSRFHVVAVPPEITDESVQPCGLVNSNHTNHFKS